jgi:hypothetical protein
MGYKISKRRREMGEEAWTKHQRQRSVKKVTYWRQRIKQKLIEYKGGRCEKCGYNKPISAVYQFHHKDPQQKKFGIAHKGKCYPWEVVKAEADKCLLLCANCHAETHHEEYIKSKNIAM